MATAHQVRSRAIQFPAGCTWLPAGSKALGFIVTESAKSVTVWQGQIPDETVDITDITQDIVYLPANPAEWTPSEVTHAENFLAAHGAEVTKLDQPQAFTYPHTGHTYVYVQNGTVNATVALHGG